MVGLWGDRPRATDPTGVTFHFTLMRLAKGCLGFNLPGVHVPRKMAQSGGKIETVSPNYD